MSESKFGSKVLSHRQFKADQHFDHCNAVPRQYRDKETKAIVKVFFHDAKGNALTIQKRNLVDASSNGVLARISQGICVELDQADKEGKSYADVLFSKPLAYVERTYDFTNPGTGNIEQRTEWVMYRPGEVEGAVAID